jgi:hypothetical protein
MPVVLSKARKVSTPNALQAKRTPGLDPSQGVQVVVKARIPPEHIRDQSRFMRCPECQSENLVPARF